jgi:hypothetical protein
MRDLFTASTLAHCRPAGVAVSSAKAPLGERSNFGVTGPKSPCGPCPRLPAAIAGWAKHSPVGTAVPSRSGGAVII